MPHLYKVPSIKDQALFMKIFGKPVNQFYNIAGFDVIKFDEFIAPPDGVSLQDVVRERYGDIAVDLVKSLF